MVQRFKKKTERVSANFKDMMRAAKALKRHENRPYLRKAATEFNVNYKVLEKYTKSILPNN